MNCIRNLYFFVFISRRLLAQLPEKTRRPIGPLCHTLFKINHERLTFNRSDHKRNTLQHSTRFVEEAQNSSQI